MKLRGKFVCEVLGTASADPELHEKFIASKSADKDKVKEEMATLPTEEAIENAVTCFPRGEEGTNGPIMFDYQFKGFLKEALGVLVETHKRELKGQGGGKLLVSKYTHKKVIDNYVFVFPREIPLVLPEGGAITRCTRPLRAQTMKGERVALATSEQLPRGTTFEVEIRLLQECLAPLLVECLSYGALKGLGQWRNSGKGRFEWEEIL